MPTCPIGPSSCPQARSTQRSICSQGRANDSERTQLGYCLQGSSRPEVKRRGRANAKPTEHANLPRHHVCKLARANASLRVQGNVCARQWSRSVIAWQRALGSQHSRADEHIDKNGRNRKLFASIFAADAAYWKQR